MEQNTGRSDDTRGLLLGILLAVFGIAFQMIGVAAALPDVMRALHGEAHYAWAFSGMVMGMLLSLLVAGPHTDRHGPLRAMTVGFALFLLGLLGGMLAVNVPTLIAARFLQGLGGGAMNLALFVVIALVFPAERRPVVMSWLSLCWLLPAFVGPPVSALLVRINWRLTFGLGVPMLLLSALLILPRVRNAQAAHRPAEVPARNPVWAVALVVASPALLQLVGVLSDSYWSVVSGVAGLAGLAVAMPRVLPERVRSLRPGLGPIVVTRALQAGAFFAGEAFLLLGLQEVRGLTAFQAGIALTIGSAGWTLGSWLQSRPWMRLRRDQIITLGTVLCALGVAGIAAFMVWSWLPLALAVLAWTLSGCGMGLMMASTAVATMALSGNHEQGRNSAALQISEALGNSVLAATVGAVHAGLVSRGVPSLGWVFLTLLVAGCASVAVSLRIGPVRDTTS